jgi:hypothetical protein
VRNTPNFRGCPKNTPNFSWGNFHFGLRGPRERRGPDSRQRRLNLTIHQLKLVVLEDFSHSLFKWGVVNPPQRLG